MVLRGPGDCNVCLVLLDAAAYPVFVILLIPHPSVVIAGSVGKVEIVFVSQLCEVGSVDGASTCIETYRRL